MKNKMKTMEGSKDVLFVVYIRTSHMTKHSTIFGNNPQPCPKSLIFSYFLHMSDFGHGCELFQKIVLCFVIWLVLI